MKFLIDQDIYFSTVRFLRELGHDVVTAQELQKSRASDVTLLNLAQQTSRIFITRDRDFGRLVFLEQLGSGVLYLRIPYSKLHEGHQELARVLNQYTVQELGNAFVVIELGRHRFRKLT
ncbi:MAG: DUF5615 family PIN-like protein [Chloroflexota bacterium]